MVTAQEQAKKVEILQAEFDGKRREFSENIAAAAAAFKNTRDLAGAEHILYDVRQKLVDYKRDLSMAISFLSKDLKRLKKNRMMDHKEGKIPFLPNTPTEKKVVDDAFFASVTAVIDDFDSQLSWAKDSISGCDEMSNGISYYIKLAQLLGGTAR